MSHLKRRHGRGTKRGKKHGLTPNSARACSIPVQQARMDAALALLAQQAEAAKPKPRRPQAPPKSDTASELAALKRRVDAQNANDMQMLLAELKLTDDTRAQAEKAGIVRVSDIVARTERYWLGFKKMSEAAVIELGSVLKGLGFEFKQSATAAA